MKKEIVLKNCEKLLEKSFSPLLRIKNYNNKSFEERKYTEKNYIRKIENYRHENDVTGFSIITGSVSHIMVLDLDRHKGKENGIEVFKELIKDFSEEDKEVIKNTFTVKTPHNGLHLYFKYKEGLKTKADIYPSIDLRTDGGLICAPFSVRENNKVYKPIDFDRQVLEMPQALYDLLYHKTFENRNNSAIQGRKVDIKYTQIKNAKNIKIKRNYKINYKILGEIIKNNISVIDILQEYYGINARNVRGNIPCPVHGGKNNNFAVYEDTNTCYCFSKCSSAYNPISLVMERTRLDYKETLLDIANRFNIDESDYIEPIEVFKPDNSKTIKLKYENYVSEKIEDIKQIIDNNKNILINAPTGGGKTKTIIDLMHKYSDDINILLTPNVIQNKQNAKAYKIQAFTGSDKNIYSNFISATFDKSEKLKELLKGRSENINVYIDECHLLVDASNYRMKAINNILDLIKIANKVVYMSATTDYIRDIIEYDKELDIKPERKINNVSSAQLLLLDNNNKEGILINQIMEIAKDSTRKTVLFLDDIETLKDIKKILLESKKFKDNEIAIINSKEKTENDEEVYDSIVECSKIPNTIKIILSTSILEVGTNINTNNVNIFVYVPKSNHMNINKIIQEVSRFRVKRNQQGNNILKIFLLEKDRKENHIKTFKELKRNLREQVQQKVDAFVECSEKIYDFDNEISKIKWVENQLSLPSSLLNRNKTFGRGIVDYNEITKKFEINEYKLQRKAKELYEQQYYYNINDLEQKLKEKLYVDTWIKTECIKGEEFKEEVKEINITKKEKKQKEKDYIKQSFMEIKNNSLEDFFVLKVIDPDIDTYSSIIEEIYPTLADTNIYRMVIKADKENYPTDKLINFIIEHADDKSKFTDELKKESFIFLNNKHRLNEKIPPEVVKANTDYALCRKVFDEVCKKRGRLTKSKKKILLMEFIKAQVPEYKNYIIQDGEVYQYKKNDSGLQPKPLKDKRIDKLVTPLIESIYNLCDDNKMISSLKKQ